MLRYFRKSIPLDHPIRIAWHLFKAMAANVYYGFPSRGMTIIGVTGTKGKTTTVNLIARGLVDAGKNVFMFSTANIYLDGKWEEHNYKMTSPSPFLLQKLLAEAKKAGAEIAVLEVSSHAMTHKRMWGIDFDTAVLTNISHEHLDLHRTMEAYVGAKFKLFEGLVSFARKTGVKKTAIVNLESAYAPVFLSTVADNLMTYGLETTAQIAAQDIECTREGTTFTLRMPGNRIPITLGIRGHFNVLNALAAISALVAHKVPLDTIVATLARVNLIPGRLQEITNRLGFSVFVDYAHTEDSLKEVLSTVRTFTGENRIVLVFGACGDRDPAKRPKMGHIASEMADVIILTDDDTYTESSEKILREVCAGITREIGDRFWIIPDRLQAIRTAILLANPGDVVLLAGKGSEQTLVTNAGGIPWSDAAVACDAINERAAAALTALPRAMV